MTDDVNIYVVDLPDGINEMVAPCLGGYTIYIDDKLSPEGKRRAYSHALYHIVNHDFEKLDVNDIEVNAHRKENGNGTI
jgi:hypothetical protein